MEVVEIATSADSLSSTKTSAGTESSIELSKLKPDSSLKSFSTETGTGMSVCEKPKTDDGTDDGRTERSSSCHSGTYSITQGLEKKIPKHSGDSEVAANPSMAVDDGIGGEGLGEAGGQGLVGGKLGEVGEQGFIRVGGQGLGDSGGQELAGGVGQGIGEAGGQGIGRQGLGDAGGQGLIGMGGKVLGEAGGQSARGTEVANISPVGNKSLDFAVEALRKKLVKVQMQSSW